MPTPLPNDYFSPEYRRATSPRNPRWRIVRTITFALTLGRDTIAIWRRADQCDHLHYRNLGHEWPLRDVVGLNHRTHALVTGLRRRGWTWFVNPLLRLAQVVWLAGWGGLGYLVFRIVG